MQRQRQRQRQPRTHNNSLRHKLSLLQHQQKQQQKLQLKWSSSSHRQKIFDIINTVFKYQPISCNVPDLINYDSTTLVNKELSLTMKMHDGTVMYSSHNTLEFNDENGQSRSLYHVFDPTPDEDTTTNKDTTTTKEKLTQFVKKLKKLPNNHNGVILTSRKYHHYDGIGFEMIDGKLYAFLIQFQHSNDDEKTTIDLKDVEMFLKKNFGLQFGKDYYYNPSIVKNGNHATHGQDITTTTKQQRGHVTCAIYDTPYHIDLTKCNNTIIATDGDETTYRTLCITSPSHISM